MKKKSKIQEIQTEIDRLKAKHPEQKKRIADIQEERKKLDDDLDKVVYEVDINDSEKALKKRDELEEKGGRLSVRQTSSERALRKLDREITRLEGELVQAKKAELDAEIDTFKKGLLQIAGGIDAKVDSVLAEIDEAMKPLDSINQKASAMKIPLQLSRQVELGFAYGIRHKLARKFRWHFESVHPSHQKNIREFFESLQGTFEASVKDDEVLEVNLDELDKIEVRKVEVA
ncbi:hypothetical protein MYX82_03780 [Acidobacteria bacterium AH-259-D05]|nr:hypothetical protein [Acidobacteria bacterium AH-259-D05]